MTQPQYHNPRQRVWYWITGEIDKDGRKVTVLLGKYATEQEANEAGFRAFDGVFETHELSTASRPEATRMLKHKLFEKTGNLSSSLERVSHQTEGE